MSIRTTYQTLRAAGKFTGTLSRALALRAEREANQPLPLVVGGKYAAILADNLSRRICQTVVPLGTLDYLPRAQAAQPRLREWSLGQEAGIVFPPWRERVTGSNSDWRKRSTFRRGITVQSYATCADWRTCVLRLAGETHHIPAPRGWRWDIDAVGLYMRSGRTAYHPTASELIGAPADLVRAARAAHAVRRAAKARTEKEQRIIRGAQQNGLAVCLRDSVRAGNCAAGTETWARAHGLDPARHYQPAHLLERANGDTSRVAIAVLAAARRHVRECAAGICQLADHR